MTCRLLLLAAFGASSCLAADAAKTWKTTCAKCHGQDGRGETKQGQKLYINDLTNPEFQAKFTDTEAMNAIRFGLRDAKGKVIMKAVPNISEADAAQLVAFVRALKKSE